MKPRSPSLVADCVVVDRDRRVLLVRRANPPFKGQFALPGGFVDIGETVEEACRRELLEETGLKVGRISLVGLYSDPDRDPRGHTVSAVFLARVGRAPDATPGSDAAAAEWRADWRRLDLAFDHAKIIRDAWRLLGKAAGKPRRPSGKARPGP